MKNANIYLREIANFRKRAKIYTRENIYVHSIPSVTVNPQTTHVIIKTFLKNG